MTRWLVTSTRPMTTVRSVNPSETINPVIPPVYDQIWTVWLIFGAAVWLVLVALYFLILYAVIVNAIRRGMRDHLLWAEDRDRRRASTAPHAVH
jgi:hypothetical protein